MRHASGRSRFRVRKPPRCAEQIVAFAKLGLGRAEIAALLRISQATLVRWSGGKPDLRDALNRAHDEALAWWETQARSGLGQGSKINASLWSKCVGTRFPSGADQVLEARSDEPRTHEESHAEVRARAKAVAALLAKAGEL